MNINHEYWHLRENDPSAPGAPISIDGASRIDIKFSFGNFLDDSNRVHAPLPFGYVPEISFKNQRWMSYLRDSRLPALAGWNKSYDQIFEVLNSVSYQIFSQFKLNGNEARPIVENGQESWFGTNNKGFGYATGHHAAGTLRMPYKTSYDSTFRDDSVVDENLQVRGAENLYVCDMSVMPYSSSANPVRTLAALALRLSERLAY
jgi:choline dehydrogenase-like flavoprotein